MIKDNNKRAENIKACHERYDLLGYRCNSLQTADDNQGSDNHNYNSDDKRNRRDHSEEGLYIQVGKECGLNVNRNFIDLSHVTDSECGKEGKNCKQNCKDFTDYLHRFRFILSSETVLQIVHCTAGPLSVFILSSVKDTKNVFGVVCHHTEECSNPHPEYCSRSADYDGCCHAGNITGTDGCRKRRTKCLELGYASLFFFIV